MAGSQLAPVEPGTVIAGPKCRPESAERAKPMPPQPIHSAYTKPGRAAASSTSALLPAQPPLMFATGPTRGLIAGSGTFGAGAELRAVGPAGAVVQACVAVTVKN